MCMPDVHKDRPTRSTARSLWSLSKACAAGHDPQRMEAGTAPRVVPVSFSGDPAPTLVMLALQGLYRRVMNTIDRA